MEDMSAKRKTLIEFISSSRNFFISRNILKKIIELFVRTITEEKEWKIFIIKTPTIITSFK